MKHAFVSACLTAGISVAKQPDRSAVKNLISRLYPFSTERDLVRLGSRGDGGYLVPDDFAGISACFSPGVDDRASFEKDMIDRGIPCFLADASVSGPPINGPMVHFVRKFIGVTNSPETITLDDWIDENKPGDDDLLLQMDIEGAEWPVLLNVSNKTLRRFRIIAIELHDMERLMDKHAFQIIKAVFDRLLENFYVVHDHPNNYGRIVRCGEIVIPRVLEMTLIRKDRVQSKHYARSFPHPLDAKNDPNYPDTPLPSSWFRSEG